MSTSDDSEDASEHPIEVQVERLPEGYDPSLERASGPEVSSQSSTIESLEQSLGPIVAGVLVDLLDAATINPLVGIVLGWPVGYYIVRRVGSPPATAFKFGALIAAYCATPGTFVIPIATVVVILAKLRLALRKA